MLRTALATVTALILSAAVAAVSMWLMLTHTEGGRLATGNTSGMVNPWQVFVSMPKVLFFYIYLPNITIVAIFVGLLARKAATIASVIAVLPISIFASGPALKHVWIGVSLVLCGALFAALTQRLIRRELA